MTTKPAAKKTRTKKPANGAVRVTQQGTGQTAVIPADEATPDLLEALKTPKRRGRPRKTPEPQVVKSTEQIIADIEAEIANFKPITDLVAQMQHVVDILKGVAP